MPYSLIPKCTLHAPCLFAHCVRTRAHTCTLHALYPFAHCTPRTACRCVARAHAAVAHAVRMMCMTEQARGPLCQSGGLQKCLRTLTFGLCWWWGWCSSEISWRPTRDFRHETYPACLRVYDTLGPRTESTGQVDPLGGASGVPVKREHDRCFQYDMLRCRFCAQAEQVANPPSPSSAATSLPARPSLSMHGLLAWAQSAAAESSLPCP